MKPPSVPTDEQWTVSVPRRPPAALEPSDRQRVAVEAYCRELCPPAEAPAASAEALAAFGVTAARLRQKATPADHERVLSRAVRLAAASHAAIERSGSGWRSWVVDTLTAERDVGCRVVPAMLARRGNGELGAAEAAALRDHLHDCLRCQAVELRMARAERTFTVVLQMGVTPPGEVVRAAASEASMVEPLVVAAQAPDVDTPAVPVPRPAPETRGGPPEPTSEPAARVDREALPPAAVTTGSVDARPSPVERSATRQRHRRVSIPIPVVLAGGVLAASGIAAVLSSGPAHHTAVPVAAAPRPAPAPVLVASTPARQRHRHRRHVVHHRPHKPKPTHNTNYVTSTVTSTSLTSAANTGTTGTTGSVGATGSSGAVAPTPPVSSAPVPSSPPTSSGGGSSSATIQQPSLGATSAPTQGIGNNH